jgi:hypothetical protein
MDRYDFFYHLEDLLVSIARSWFNRPPDLRELDDAREKNPLGFNRTKCWAAFVMLTCLPTTSKA